MVKVKICGITNLKDARAAIAAGADAVGFVFAESPRRISHLAAKGIIEKVKPVVNFVGVFADAPQKTVKKTTTSCRIDTLQFHGHESPAYCRYFMDTHKVIKAFRIKDKEDLQRLKRYKVDGYLLDTFVKGAKGGTGRAFDWRLASQAKKLVHPVILSGGLNPKNVSGAIRAVRPYAVDVSSGVESRPGKKDARLIKRFMDAARGNKDEKDT
jgi:phosphoribosylanthranilate isomerase